MPAPDKYITIARSGSGEYREKGSRFYGFAEKTTDESQAEEMRSRLRKESHDATHQPFAYRLADGTERSSDDGEPRGTSGPSILTQIQAADLYDVQVVVVRYFGGTKLGKGGLARAFSECTKSTVADAGTRKVQNSGAISIIVSPADANIAKAIAAKYQAEITAISYDINAHIQFSIPMSNLEACRKSLLDRFGSEIFKSNS